MIPKQVETNFKFVTDVLERTTDLGVMECQDAKTKEIVYVLVAFFDNPMTKEITTLPLARMFTGNPYDEVNPPDSNDPTGFLEGA